MSRLFLLLALAAGCADSISPGDDEPPPPTTGKFATTSNADGSFTTIVDATSMTAWVYADFETRAEIADTGPWDLRFQRFHVSANGGVSGTGGVEVAPVTGAAFDSVTAPATGFVTDVADGDGDGLPDYVLDQGDTWYAYDVDTHVLAPRPIVWVVKTDGGAEIKLEIEQYYDEAGTSGWLTLHWGPM